MRKKYKLPGWIKINIENELQHFYENVKLLDERKEEIISESPPPPDGQPRGNSVGNPVESKVIRMNTKTIILLERKLNSIWRVKHSLNKDDEKLFDIMYKEGFNARLAETYKNISQDIFYAAKRRFQYLVAIELGYI